MWKYRLFSSPSFKPEKDHEINMGLYFFLEALFFFFLKINPPWVRSLLILKLFFGIKSWQGNIWHPWRYQSCPKVTLQERASDQPPPQRKVWPSQGATHRLPRFPHRHQGPSDFQERRGRKLVPKPFWHTKKIPVGPGVINLAFYSVCFFEVKKSLISEKGKYPIREDTFF